MKRPLAIPAHAHPLVRLLFQEIANSDLGLETVSIRSGVNRSTIGTWRWKHNPQLTALEAALNVVGYELVAVPKRRA